MPDAITDDARPARTVYLPTMTILNKALMPLFEKSSRLSAICSANIGIAFTVDGADGLKSTARAHHRGDFSLRRSLQTMTSVQRRVTG